MSSVSVGQQLELSPDRPGHGGFSVARHDGQAVFVRGALPGERVRAEITEARKSYLRAQTTAVLSPSAHRVAEACPAAAAGAGCCDLTIATPAYQREIKEQVLADLLVRFGRFPVGELRPEVRGLDDGPVTGWRRRSRLVADGRGRLGQYAHRSAEVVVAPCAQTPPELRELVESLQVRRAGTEVALVLDDAAAVHAVAVGDKNTAAVRVITGPGVAEYRYSEHRFELPVPAFWQAHRSAADRYAEVVTEWAERYGAAGRAWDLYGGAGLFAAALSDAGRPVDVVETAGPAIAAGKHALRGRHVRFHRAEVATGIRTLDAPSVVVLDPPRSGAGAKTMAAVAAARPSLIIHIGCDPAAFARDLGALAGHGYRIAELRAFDAFPGTHHCEAFAALVPVTAE